MFFDFNLNFSVIFFVVLIVKPFFLDINYSLENAHNE